MSNWREEGQEIMRSIWSAVVIGFGAEALKSCHRFQV
jgi:hypothetical protein